jgi:hypothetical protein
MQYHEQIPGWFDFANIYDDMVARARDGAVFVEIGAYLGRSTAYLGAAIKRSGKKIRVYVIDLWDGWFYDDDRQQTPMREGGDVFWHFVNNMRRGGVDDVLCPLKMPSAQAVTLFDDGSLDFVFIDGDHGYEAVRRDLTTWFPKVRRGGILGGHDYVNNDFPGVRRAVDEFFAAQELPFEVNGTSFMANKPRPRWLGTALRAYRRLCPAGG